MQNCRARACRRERGRESKEEETERDWLRTDIFNSKIIVMKSCQILTGSLGFTITTSLHALKRRLTADGTCYLKK